LAGTAEAEKLSGQNPAWHCKGFISAMGTLALIQKAGRLLCKLPFYDSPLSPLIKAGN
jgi:hypothetical protein